MSVGFLLQLNFLTLLRASSGLNSNPFSLPVNIGLYLVSIINIGILGFLFIHNTIIVKLLIFNKLALLNSVKIREKQVKLRYPFAINHLLASLKKCIEFEQLHF